jgi:hypothetical protein
MARAAVDTLGLCAGDSVSYHLKSSFSPSRKDAKKVVWLSATLAVAKIRCR